MLLGKKHIMPIGIAVVLALSALIEPAQAARSPKNPKAVSASNALSNPVELNENAKSAADAAAKHLRTQGPSWGINPNQFTVDSAIHISEDFTVVRFTQHTSGSIFLGAVAALTVNTDGSLMSYSIQSGRTPAGMPSTNSAAAESIAKDYFSKTHQVASSDVQIGTVTAAIADPTLQSYVTSSTWVWFIEVYASNSLASSKITVDSNSLLVLNMQDAIHTLNSNPLVCNMQMMNTSTTKKKSKLTYVSYASIKLKATKSANPLTGIQGGKVWAVLVVSNGDAVSSKVLSVKVKKSQAVALSPKYAYVPGNATYSVYVGTGKSKPSADAMKLMATGPVSPSNIVLTGGIPQDSASFASAGIAANTFYTFINTSANMPICDYKNKGTKKPSPDALAEAEKNNTYNYINGFRSYFASNVSATTDIGSEMYVGNVSAKLNYGKKNKCGGSDETGYCTPRITAFTNACLMMSGSLSCPNFDNAAWTAWRSSDCRSGVCNGIFIGRGFAVNDVIAHELTHGLTSAIAFGAINSTSAAISEALSDVFGESFDQISTGVGNDPAWNIGEDLNTANFHGAVRNMQGTSTGANPVIDSCWNNNGEMHANVGPVNRFAWLLVNGGDPYIAHGDCLNNPSVGRSAITPIGTTPTESIQLMNQLIWAAIPSMGTPSAGSSISFQDFGSIVQVTCNSIWGVSNPTRCDSVHQALVATGMATP